MTQVIDFIGFNNFLSKINTYKIKNQLNIKVIGKKKSNQNKLNVQLIINQILNDEIKK
jgi:hypothetical protein